MATNSAVSSSVSPAAAASSHDGLRAYPPPHANSPTPQKSNKVLDNATRTVYIYNGWQAVEEYENGTLARQYVYGGQYIDEPVCKIEDPAGAATKQWYIHDVNYNIIALVGSSLTPDELYNYSPYGNVTITDGNFSNPRTSTAYGNTLMFQGRRFDSETGLYYFRNRYYSPELGRFLQRDSAGYVDGMSLYEFVGGRPVSRTDPFGLWTEPKREGGRRANVCAEEDGDPIIVLAQNAGHDESQAFGANGWLKDVNGGVVTSIGEIEKGSTYSVPNTAYVAIGDISTWWPMSIVFQATVAYRVGQIVDRLEDEGYEVSLDRAATVSDMEKMFQYPDIVSFTFYGHGYEGEIFGAGGKGKVKGKLTDEEDAFMPRGRKPPHHRLALVELYACTSGGKYATFWKEYFVSKYGSLMVSPGIYNPRDGRPLVPYDPEE